LLKKNLNIILAKVGVLNVQRCKTFHIYKGGGTEFYDRYIIDLLEPYFKNVNIPYKILTKEEINLMNRHERVRNIPNVDKVM